MKKVGVFIFSLVFLLAISGFVVAETNETSDCGVGYREATWGGCVLVGSGPGCCSVLTSGEICAIATADDCADDSFFTEGVLCAQTSYCQKGCCYDEDIGVYERNVLEGDCWADWNADSNCNMPGAELGCCVFTDYMGFGTEYQTEKMCEIDSNSFGLPMDFRYINELECDLLTEPTESYEYISISFDEVDLYSSYDNAAIIEDAPVIVISGERDDSLAIGGNTETNEAYIYYAPDSTSSDHGALHIYYKDIDGDHSPMNKARYVMPVVLDADGTLFNEIIFMEIRVGNTFVPIGARIVDGSMELIFSTVVPNPNGAYVSDIILNIGGDILSDIGGTLERLGNSAEDAESGDIIADGVDVSNNEAPVETGSGIIIGENNFNGVQGNADEDWVFLSIPAGGPDYTAPVILGSGYSTSSDGNGYTSVQFSLDTNEVAECSFSRDGSQYIQMFNTHSTQHWQDLTLPDGVHDIYIKCADFIGNINYQPYVMTIVTSSGNDRIMEVEIRKGWNLIYGFVEPDQITDGNIDESDIRAIYALMPNLQEYAMTYPELDEYRIRTMDDDDILNSGMWVYSDVSGYMEYELYVDIMPFNQRAIFAGWNFVGITSDMMIDDIEDLAGTCNIQRSYVFDHYEQDWVEFPLHEDFFEDLIGYTWVINVNEDCRLNRDIMSIVPAPPVLPGMNDGGFDTDEPMNIEGWELVDVYVDDDCGYDNDDYICMDITGLQYERVIEGNEERIRVSLLDYNKGIEFVKEEVGQYLTNVDYGFDNMYGLLQGDGLAWFSNEHDLIVVEIYGMVKANAVVEYFYNKYSAIDVGLEVLDCVDTDGGINYFESGAVFQSFTPSGPKYDECIDDETLKEWSCVGQETFRYDDYVCPNGCQYDRCVPDGECVLEGVSEKGCYFDDVYYNVKKLGGCGVTPVSFELSYENQTENFEVEQGAQYLLGNNVTFNLNGAPCGYDIMHIQFERHMIA